MSQAVIDDDVSSSTPGKGLNIALWVVQGLLALAFVGAASGKLLGLARARVLRTLGAPRGAREAARSNELSVGPL
jgi:hypothetical protein